MITKEDFLNCENCTICSVHTNLMTRRDIDLLNNWKERYIDLRKDYDSLLNKIIKSIPPTLLKDFLLKKKLIKEDYLTKKISLGKKFAGFSGK